jgi:hypothetical protein
MKTLFPAARRAVITSGEAICILASSNLLWRRPMSRGFSVSKISRPPKRPEAKAKASS